MLHDEVSCVVDQVRSGDGLTPVRAVARVDLYAFGVTDQEHLSSGRHKVRRDVRRAGLALATCVMAEVAVVAARPTPTVRQRRASRVIPASTPRRRTVRGAFTQRTRASSRLGVLAMVASMRADCGRWAAWRGERGLGGANGGYRLLPVRPDCAASACVPTTSGPTSVAHADPQIERVVRPRMDNRAS